MGCHWSAEGFQTQQTSVAHRQQQQQQQQQAAASSKSGASNRWGSAPVEQTSTQRPPTLSRPPAAAQNRKIAVSQRPVSAECTRGRLLLPNPNPTAPYCSLTLLLPGGCFCEARLQIPEARKSDLHQHPLGLGRRSGVLLGGPAPPNRDTSPVRLQQPSSRVPAALQPNTSSSTGKYQQPSVKLRETSGRGVLEQHGAGGAIREQGAGAIREQGAGSREQQNENQSSSDSSSSSSSSSSSDSEGESNEATAAEPTEEYSLDLLANSDNESSEAEAAEHTSLQQPTVATGGSTTGGSTNPFDEAYDSPSSDEACDTLSPFVEDSDEASDMAPAVVEEDLLGPSSSRTHDSSSTSQGRRGKRGKRRVILQGDARLFSLAVLDDHFVRCSWLAC